MSDQESKDVLGTCVAPEGKIDEFLKTVSDISSFLNGEGDAANIASIRLREAILKYEARHD